MIAKISKIFAFYGKKVLVGAVSKSANLAIARQIIQ